MSSRAARTRAAGSRLAAALIAAATIAACGSGHPHSGGTTTTTATTPLPGTGKPSVTIGDKNYTEQFILGELYDQALSAEGYSVTLDVNIGPTPVTFQALISGRLDMYPEYIDVWDAFVAGQAHPFPSARAALAAGRAYAKGHGLALLTPTPFSDTNAVATTTAYATAHHLRSLGDLAGVAAGLTFGAPTQFQDSSVGLPRIERAYGFRPASVSTLDIGAQYDALLGGKVQAAYLTTTDGQLAGGSYRMLSDPQHVFGWGNATPVVPLKVLAAEGPAFKATIDRVSRLLTLPVMRRLNAEVEIDKQSPTDVAKAFLQQRGVIPKSS